MHDGFRITCALQVIKQSATLFNFLGALQQKAPAQVTITDSLVHDMPPDPEWEAIMAMPATIVSQMKDIETLAASLPKLRTEVRKLVQKAPSMSMCTTRIPHHPKRTGASRCIECSRCCASSAV
jgi:hypothetical protein